MRDVIREYRRGRLGWLSLPLLEGRGVLHGFTFRRGGASRGKFASLNFTTRQGDKAERVRKNWRRLEEAGGLDPGNWALVSQVHGAKVAVARDGGPFCLHRRRHSPADAVVAARPGIVSGVLTADCLPALIASGDGKTVAAAHAGWQGSLAGVVVEAVKKMTSVGGLSPADLAVGLGPAIGVCCYQVGEEVYLAFREKWGSDFARRVFTRADPWRFDLQKANRLQLLEAGVRGGNIAAVHLCTVCRGDLFFSHRRDGERTGRMLGFIRGT